MPISGGETVAGNIRNFGGGFLKHVKVVMIEVTADLDKEVTKNMSLTDHTIDDLRALGHPYSEKRWGSTGMAGFHDPYWQVHKQSGRLLRSKDSGVIGPSVAAGELTVKGYVRLNEVDVEYANAIIWGNGRMIPRDFLSGSVNNKDFQDRTKSYLVKNLRDLVLNFKGVETR